MDDQHQPARPNQTLALIRDPEPSTQLTAAEAMAPIGQAERLDRLRAHVAASRKAQSAAAERVLAAAGPALRRAVLESDPVFTPLEQAALEAVILTDGSRPSLTVGEDYVDTFAAEAKDWGVDLRAFEHGVACVIAAVGRLTIPQAPRLIGSVLAVTADLVVTNRHVVQAIAEEADGGWRLRWPDKTEVNFRGEAEAPGAPTHRVRQIVRVGPDAIGDDLDLAKLDLALLQIEPLGQGAGPRGVQLWPRPGLVTPGRAICVIGFPGRPSLHLGPGPPPGGLEAEWVMQTVFGDTFGVKKLAPGRIVADGLALTGAPARPVFSHDCSTLRGSSGSVAVDLGEAGGRVVGVHFGGRSRSGNYAHDLPALSSDLDWPLPWARGA